MLALALESIRKADNHDTDVRIFADTGTNMSELEYVRDNYFPEADIFQAQPHAPARSGTWNILNALKHAAVHATDHAHLIEEDVLVAKDYFIWSHHNVGPESVMSGRWHPSGKYTNPGATFSKNFLEDLSQHINEKFFADPAKYMDEFFPGTTDASPHDDGLIRRFVTFEQYPVLIPGMPKVAHIGFHAYNRYDKWVNDGCVSDRITTVRKMLAAPLTQFTKDNEFRQI